MTMIAYTKGVKAMGIPIPEHYDDRERAAFLQGYNVGANRERGGEPYRRGEMPYDEHAFHDDLNENMADDPYGTASYIISQALKGAESYNPNMSEYELNILREIGAVCKALDKHFDLPLMWKDIEENPNE